MIQAELKNKVGEFLKNYLQIKWDGNDIHKKCVDFVEDMAQYLEGTFVSMTIIWEEITPQCIYVTFKNINETMMDILLEIKKYNIVGLYNLDLDWVYLFSVCRTKFSQYQSKKIMKMLVLRISNFFLKYIYTFIPA